MTAIRTWLQLPRRHETLVRELILEPAVKFHSMMHCSGKKFSVRYKKEMEVRSVGLLDIESWTLSRTKQFRGVLQCYLPRLVMDLSLDQREVELAPPLILGFVSEKLDPNTHHSPIRHDNTRLDSTEYDTASSHEHQRSSSRQGHRSGRRTPSRQSSRNSAPRVTKYDRDGRLPPSNNSLGGIATLLRSLTGGRGDEPSSRKNSYSHPPPSPGGRSSRRPSVDSGRQGRTSPDKIARGTNDPSYMPGFTEEPDEEYSVQRVTKYVIDDSGSEGGKPLIRTVAPKLYESRDKLLEQTRIDPKHPSMDI